MVRADINTGGWDIKFDYENLQEALIYVGLMHNHFGKSRESDFSPLELIAGRRLSKPTSALFGSTVLAEIPSSLQKDCPNETRQIECAYLHPGIDHGPIVQGKMRIDGQRYLARFSARNVRQITPISWKADLCDSFLNKFDFDGGPDDLAIEPPRDPKGIVGDEPQDDLPVPLEPPKSVRNPRVQFDDEDLRQFEKQFDLKRPDLDDTKTPAQKKARFDDGEKLSLKRSYSKTPGCPSCDTGMVAPGIRHSAKCRRINQPVVVPETPQRGSDTDMGEPDANVAVGVENSECDYSPTTAPPSPQRDIEVEIPQENEFVERSKRRHDDEADDVGRELKRERLDELRDDNALGRNHGSSLHHLADCPHADFASYRTQFVG